MAERTESQKKFQELVNAAEGLLTEEEHRAVDLAGELYVLLTKIVGNGATREADLNELIAPIHHIQHKVMAQAAGRAFPGRYRLLGEVIGE